MPSPTSTPSHIPDAADKRPMYILLSFAFLLNAYFFFIGTVCVRLWFYKGDLGPEPEKFIILRKDLKERYRKSLFPGAEPTEERGRLASSEGEKKNGDVGKSTALDPTAFTGVPKISIHNTDEYEDFSDSKIREYVQEERRISHLPAFVQDDCGDGSEFPDVPVAESPIEPPNPLMTALQHTSAHIALGLIPIPETDWLLIDSTYISQHTSRAAILASKRTECIQSTRDGEAACEELLDEVVDSLTTNYPHHFRVKTKRMRKYVRNELTEEEFALKRPWDVHPLEVLARLGCEDWQVFGKGEFTGEWYLQASATVFPAGWHMRKHIGKSLDLIINNMNEPMPVWEDIPEILSLPNLTPYAFTPTLLSHTTTYIQTLSSPTSQPRLHIQRPVDFFPGALQNLLPSSLLLRTETTTFRRLPRTGAIVMCTRNRTRGLTDIRGEEKEELLKEVEGWGEDEARFKGRDLWVTSLRGWCLGRPVFRDDRTVWSSGAPVGGY